MSGPTARARVTQIFRNPTEGWVEAVYVYPLPEGGAVDSLKMVIGDRVVIGDIKERKEARAIYEEAKAAGRKTTLLEQERPNLFTNSVANIGPGETVLVQIEYQEPVRQSGEHLLAARAARRRAALQSEARRADRRLRSRRPGLGHAPPTRSRTATASSRRCSTRARRADQSGRDRDPPAGRLPARRGEEPSPRGADRDVVAATPA